MLMTTDGQSNTYGDGSLEHPHDSGTVSRLYLAKEALNTVISAYGEVRWGLARFQQNSGHNYFCSCSDEIPNNVSGCGGYGGLWDPMDDCLLCDMMQDYPDYDLPGTHDRVCINYAGGVFAGCTDPISGVPLIGADILVPVGAGNQNTILGWIDHSESDPGEPGYNAALAPEDEPDPELRASGGTPIGGSLMDLYNQLANFDLGADPQRGCRPYSIIVLTDGAESCNSDPVNWATQLRSIEDLSQGCGAGCPPNSTCNGSHCVYEVQTHVIAFAVAPNEFLNANDIAVAGGTGGAIQADDQAELVAAMAQIIADSIRTEQCDNIDHDCDGDPVNGFPVGDFCSKGQGECYATGTYECDPSDPANVVCNADDIAPTTEVCDGVDNDCDGLVDEDDVCCQGPEMCDGLDNYCGNRPSWMHEGDEDPRIWSVYPQSGVAGTALTCGTDVGMCSTGSMICGVSGPECSGGQGAQTEVCDLNDWNCNGLTNDVPPESCNITVSGVGTCPGVRICSDAPADCSGTPVRCWSACLGQTPAPEICNGQDDNCDGNADEGLDTSFQCGVGRCERTLTYCVSGTLTVCDPYHGATAEQCNNVDDDCDGQTDEGLGQTTCGLGICEHTIPNCVNGSTQTCDPMQDARTETCNGLDDDCNGLDDDGLAPRNCYPTGPGGCTEVTPGTFTCVGECHWGTQSCSGGAWGGCVSYTTPVPEICDGKDNDCNGTADDGLGQTTCGLGNCQKTVDNCDNGTPQICDPLAEASPETCDGYDENCNGVVDDGVSRACYTGDSNTRGVGECKDGAEACVVGGSPPGQWSGTCVGETLPTTEICDGKDNDCDGTADDNIVRDCYTAGVGCTAQGGGGYTCVGACRAGTQTCIVGSTVGWNSCSGEVGPTAETCNGADDDCDGDIDEDGQGNPLSQSCSKTDGTDTCYGVKVCANGSYGACSAQDPGPEEWDDPTANLAVCDTIDQNCNGVVNDGVSPRTCQVTNSQGTCTGTQNCTAAGSWTTCTARTPAAETCNGVDDDCDGDIDEDAGGNPLTQACYTGPGATRGVGACTDGLRTCTNGGWGPCVGQMLPTPEICDGADNDCDHDTDEDVNGNPITQACQNSNTSGTCLGSQTCTGQVGNLWTPCDAEVPAAEVCDGQDNNCDGVIDGISEACYPYSSGCAPDGAGSFNCDGICWPGIRVCPALGAPAASNSFGACNLAVGPTTETCNGLDDDCDGSVDEGQDGSPLERPCYWPGYGADTGCTSEGNCVGACTEGSQICGDVNVGEWGQCQGEVTPATEVCDGTDNDCDGQIDEPSDMPWIGQPCPASLGVCNGIWACNSGVKQCVGGHVNPGRCNGLDDDCDGVTDELDELQQDPMYGQACGTDEGECEQGTQECIGGSWQCVGSVEPSEEVCDGVDNDCDGVIDVGADCAPVGGLDTYCVEGDCRIECDATAEFPCPGGMECVQKPFEGQNVTVCMPIVGECGGQICPDGWVCQNDVCVDPCNPNPCAGWQQCVAGQCLDTSCSGPNVDCPHGQFCVEHECVTDPCASMDCGAQDGYCVRDCSGTSCTASCRSVCLCPLGEYCDESGECVTDPCAGTQCNSGERCDPLSGQCEPDPCAAMLCQGFETCFEGECIPDPCDQLECPALFNCVIRPTEDATGNPAPWAQCEPDDALWIPGASGDTYLATGQGCQCQSGGGGASGGLPLLLLLLGLVWRRRRLGQDAAGPGARRAWLLGAGILGLILAASGCKVDGYSTARDGGWLLRDAGPVDAFVSRDASPDACVPQTEVCNGEDDDCDGVADNGFNLQADPNNCGTCGHVCDIPNAVSSCEEGDCVMSGCLPGHHDVNQDPSDGCEYDCHPTNDGTELCDGMDNDCDGDIDEDFDLHTDPLNCGACSNVCVFLNGNGACVNGQCTMASCRGGFVDLDGSAQNGCECHMDLTAGTVDCVDGQTGTCASGEVCADVTGDGSAHCATVPLDTCDGRDNDCDGAVDEDFAAVLSTTACYTYTSGCSPNGASFDCQGLCVAGTWACAAGELVCNGQTGPVAESCNDQDDDCNGTVDDGVDKQTDPNNCGACGHQCGPLLPNAIPGCTAGQCVIVDCLPGYWDHDANQPGCEYPCTVTNGGVEACGDGLDNDCNGQTDEGFNLPTDVNNCGSCGHSCEVYKPYGTAVVSPNGCVSGHCQFQCLANYYDRDNDLVSAGELGNGCEEYCEITNTTELCDGLDNDCNGQVDEGFDTTQDLANCGACGRSCDAIKGTNTVATSCTTSVCQYSCVTNYVDLNGDIALGQSGNGCECHVTAESCDNQDDDCDGIVDNPGASGCTDYYKDADQDGFGDPNDSRCLCAPDTAARYTAPLAQATDCDDSNNAVNPNATEVCDTIDNDCDGEADTVGGNALTRSCYTGAPGTDTHAPCTAGTQTCSGGNWSSTCVGEVTPELETCNGTDDNCDGHVDEGFHTDTDANNCGGCGTVCTVEVPHAVTNCQGGVCQLISCLPGYHDIDSNVPGCEYACTYQNGGVKTCGSTDDNDCNGTPDDQEFHLQEDPDNCLTCGHSCAANRPPGTQVSAAPNGCNLGVCYYDCLSGYHDLDNDRSEGSNGCECVETNGGTETCDDIDNNCDGQVDEDTDKQNDPTNCGSCNNVCSAQIPPNAELATPACVTGQCRYVCLPNFYDRNGDLHVGALSDGCEDPCTPTTDPTERCDGVDNDCDGHTDADSNGQPLTRVCYPPGYGATTGCTSQGSCVGVCTEGAETCDGAGNWGSCLGAVTPTGGPVCDSTNDNDCNGTADNLEINKDDDVQNCGTCGNNCLTQLPANAVTDSPGCVTGQCRFVCLPGFADFDGDLNDGTPAPADGCEHTCERYPTLGYEECNGIDDDCDGDVDEAVDLEAAPAICKNDAGTPCAGSVAQCTDLGGSMPKGWYCNYPATVETVPGNPNAVLTSETLCDGQDGDCDGIADDDFNLGSECDNGLLGTCRDQGVTICKPGDPSAAPICDLSVPPDAINATPQPETCNGLDDDCDGLTDESGANPGSNASYVQDDLVPIQVGGQTVWVYQYEASRPEATAASQGSGAETRACSRSGVMPWSKVTYEQARMACQRAGMGLCGDVEWTEACDGNAGSWAYPYSASTYDPNACNGLDSGAGVAETTGSQTDCSSEGWGAQDLSGNLREWTTEVVAYTPSGKAIYAVRGGSYTDPADGLRCDFKNTGLVEDAFTANVGFRCCTRCGNGTVDPGEECDDSNRTGGDGCSAVCGPDTCGDGVLDGPREECDCGTDPDHLPGGCIAVNGAGNANCTVTCQRADERCSSLYPEDQDDEGEANDCADGDCAGTRCSDVVDNDGDGFSEVDGDCDDTDPTIHPAADEICGDSVDQNCNGSNDDTGLDLDGDGEERCVGGVVNDCDDWDPDRSPALLEICGDGIDNDCDGLVDVNCATPCEIAAYERSYIGCEYWPTSTANSQLSTAFNDNFGVVVFNDNASSATVTIHSGATQVDQQVVAAGASHTFTLPFNTTLKMTYGSEQTERVTNGAYRLTSTLPVTVYQFNPLDYQLGSDFSYTNDAALLLPSHVLDTHYIVMARQTWGVTRDCWGTTYDFNWSYDPGFMTIVGTENNTSVQVTYSAYTAGGDEPASSPGQVRNYTLNRGEVLQVISYKPTYGTACGGTSTSGTCGTCSCSYCDLGSSYDLTGTIITSSAPVAVYSGSNCAFVPYNYWACDHLEEQLFPTATWGRNFVVARTEPQNMSSFPEEPNVFRIISGADGNLITFNPAQPTVGSSVSLDQGEWVEFESTDNFTVSGTEAVMVTQFLVGQDYYSDNPNTWHGDPAYALAVPREQYRTSYSFLVPSTMTYNWLNIVKPVAQPGKNAPTVYLNGTPIPESDFSGAIGDSYFGVARIDLTADYAGVYDYVITSDQPFGIMVYGFARYTSYFYPGGLDLNIINSGI